MRSAIRTLRQNAPRGARFNSSSSSAPNPQVQKAVENAQKAFAQTQAAVSKVAGPVGQKVGNALGGECGMALFVFAADGEKVIYGERGVYPKANSALCICDAARNFGRRMEDRKY